MLDGPWVNVEFDHARRHASQEEVRDKFKYDTSIPDMLTTCSHLSFEVAHNRAVRSDGNRGGLSAG